MSGFSSNERTAACSGGFSCNPTTSTSFITIRWSRLSLNDRVKCGVGMHRFQARSTVMWLTPTRCAIARVDLCVAPRGFSCKVACTRFFGA